MYTYVIVPKIITAIGKDAQSQPTAVLEVGALSFISPQEQTTLFD